MRLLLLILSLNFTLLANHVNWYSNFENAHKQALKQNKQIMVLLIKKECVECVDVLKKTFINQVYIDKINKKFISVVIIKGQKTSYPIEMLYTNEYPTLFFLDKYELFSCDYLKGRITPKNLEIHLKRCKY